MQTERVLADFAGTWSVARSIVPTAGPDATFEGTARWMPGAEGLDYVEQGVLRMEGAAPMQAERRYHWSDELNVYFADGRFFHSVPARGGQTTHFCDPDTYDGSYDFADWPRFSVTWDVRGPRKDYRMTSVFTRLAEP